MNGKRLFYTLRLFTISTGTKRAEYLRSHGVFSKMGHNCVFMDRKVPLYPELIKIGDNVHFSSNVTLATHDIVHIMLNNTEHSVGGMVNEHVGCIEFGDNIYIGTNSTILYDTKIGSNVIIGAGSIVTKDIPNNSVAVGTPARVIASFDDYVNRLQSRKMLTFKKKNGIIDSEDCSGIWKKFEQEHTDL